MLNIDSLLSMEMYIAALFLFLGIFIILKYKWELLKYKKRFLKCIFRK